MTIAVIQSSNFSNTYLPTYPPAFPSPSERYMCVYVCIYVCMYVYMYVCMYVCVYNVPIYVDLVLCDVALIMGRKRINMIKVSRSQNLSTHDTL